MAEWRTMPFSDAVMINPPVRLKRGETYPFVAMADVEPAVRSVHSPQERKFRGSGARFESGDTLMARITPCLENGKIGRYHSPMSLRVAHGSTEFIVIRGRSGVTDNEFAYYLAQSNGVRDYAISQMSGTSGRQRVPTQSLEHLNVRVPSLAQQYAIARTLGMLDDKIDLNRRMNETLEAMARAIFKDWFVDFGPTRAKAEGRTRYLAPELWDLFPDALDDEGKPVGWVTQPVNHLFEFNPRETLKMGTCAPYLDMAALPTSGLTPNLPRQRKFKSGSKYRDGDTLFARITPCLENGKTAFVFGLGDAVIGAGSTEFIVIRSKKPLPQAASYLLARGPEFRAHAKRSMTGTSGRQRANVAAAGNYEMTTPQAEGPWKALAALVEPLVDGVIANAQESRTLSETRDLLLPKLMSGELRLRDAEKAIEAVA